jgi:hypothetical protein
MLALKQLFTILKMRCSVSIEAHLPRSYFFMKTVFCIIGVVNLLYVIDLKFIGGAMSLGITTLIVTTLIVMAKLWHSA